MAREITYNNFEISLVVFMPNITKNHAFTYTYLWNLLRFQETYFNEEEFPRSFSKGAYEGFWWAFVSMTTVGYVK